MINKNKKQLLTNFFSLSILKGLQFIIPLITLPYLVRVLGVEKFGLVNFSLSLSLYFGAIIQFGFAITSTREIARNLDNSIKVAQIYSATVYAQIFFSLVSIVIFHILTISFEFLQKNYLINICTLMFVISQSLFPVWFFQGIEKMKFISLLTITGNTVTIIGILTFINNRDDYILVPIIQSISGFVILIISIILIKAKMKISLTRPDLYEIRKIIKKSKDAFITQFAPNLYNNSAVFMLGVFSNNTIVGVYTASTRIIDAVISMGYILSNTFFPFLSRRLNNFYIFHRIMIVTGSVLTLLLFVMSEQIVLLLFGDNNLEIIKYVRYLSLSVILIFLSLTYGNNFLMLIGKENINRNITMVTSIMFFFIGIILIKFYNIFGATLMIIGARMTLSITQAIFYTKYKEILK